MRLHRLRFALAAAFALGAHTAAAGVNAWTATWPFGYGGGHVVVDPDSATVYGGGSYMLKSENNGGTWLPACASVPGMQPLSARSGAVYATDGEQLYQSLDGGSHCSVLSSDSEYRSSYDLQIDPFDANVLYRNEVRVFPRVGIPFLGSVLSRSQDRGVTWTDVGSGLVGGGYAGVVTALALDTHHSGVLYAAVIGGVPGLGPYTLSKSSDAGSSWTQVSSGTVIGMLALDPFATSTVYAASGASIPNGVPGTFKSVDGGVTFQTINPFLTRQIVVDPKHRDRVYIATEDAGILVSTDAGATWTAINDGLPSERMFSLALDPTGSILHASDGYNVYEYQVEELSVLLLDPGRSFSVTLTATDQRTGRTGRGVALSASSVFGYFSIPAITGNPGNPEVFVKMLDGTPVNDRYWFFYGGLTDLEYTLTVTDNVTGAVRTYSKPAGSECGGSDTAAFSP